ncbi:MAG: hypothetical protein ACP5IB_01920 [Thermoplasmata archaeon]
MNFKIKTLIITMLLFGVIFYPISLSQNLSNPVWGFKNAYLKYNATTTILGIKEYFSVRYTIIYIYQNNGSFVYTENFSSVKYRSLSENITLNGNYSDPNGFPAVSTNDLNYLNQGKIPEDMNSSVKSVIPNVQIKVPAGTYNTDKIIGNYGTVEYVDMSTGIIVDENITLFGLNLNLKLTNTNIKPIIIEIVYVIIAVVILLLLVLAVFLRSIKRR